MSDDDVELTAGEEFMADTAAAAVGLWAGPIGGLGVPWLAKKFKDVNREFKKEQAEMAAAVIMGAADELDVPPSKLLERVNTPEARRLWSRATIAGANTDSAEKIAALGRVLARGLGSDHASIDVDAMIVSALADMEAPHIKVLAVVGGGVPFRPPHAGHTCRTSTLLIELPGYRSVMPAILAVLERHGLVRLRPIGKGDIDFATQYGPRFGESPVGTETWELTTFGFECLEFLRPAD